MQARTLMERLQIALEQESSKQHRQRLRRTLRRASQRTLRRLRAEQHEPPTESTDEPTPPTLPPLQSVLVGRSTKAHLTIDNRITLCGYHLDAISTAAPSFIEHHDCPRCAQQARALGYTLP